MVVHRKQLQKPGIEFRVRGPTEGLVRFDNQCAWNVGAVSNGHVRLSVLDPSSPRDFNLGRALIRCLATLTGAGRRNQYGSATRFLGVCHMSESQPSKVFLSEANDPEMQRAYESARASFRYFWREIAWERRRIVPALDLALCQGALLRR